MRVERPELVHAHRGGCEDALVGKSHPVDDAFDLEASEVLGLLFLMVRRELGERLLGTVEKGLSWADVMGRRQGEKTR